MGEHLLPLLCSLLPVIFVVILCVALQHLVFWIRDRISTGSAAKALFAIAVERKLCVCVCVCVCVSAGIRSSQ
jgi:hypothetical protein